MDFTKELEAKRLHDQEKPQESPSLISTYHQPVAAKRVWVPGPVIIGAGPTGLAVAASLKQLGIPRLILERSNCIASLWRYKTYDRLRLHLPKSFCELPDFPFPANFPTYPTKHDFIAYLDAYAKRFGIRPVFDKEVVSAEFDERRGVWRVRAVVVGEKKKWRKEVEMIEYECRWVVVATGENEEAVVPEIEGGEEYEGRMMHTCEYKSGEEMKGKNVMVVGCGNSGMEVSLDLVNHGAFPSLVVRDSVHVLPQEMLGTSTFGLSKRLLKWFPAQLVDRILLLGSRLVIGDTSWFGLHRPAIGPLELKSVIGKTPVLDIGTVAQIRAGNIKVFPGIRRIFRDGAEFVDGRVEKFDAIIFATGFRSNVRSWLKGSNIFSKQDGFSVKPLPDGWKGDNGLYAAGFSKQGILGLSLDARRIAQDIHENWGCGKKQVKGCPRATLRHIYDDNVNVI